MASDDKTLKTLKALRQDALKAATVDDLREVLVKFIDMKPSLACNRCGLPASNCVCEPITTH